MTLCGAPPSSWQPCSIHQSVGREDARRELQGSLDLLCNCLGLLINIAERAHSEEHAVRERGAPQAADDLPEGLQETVSLVLKLKR